MPSPQHSLCTKSGFFFFCLINDEILEGAVINGGETVLVNCDHEIEKKGICGMKKIKTHTHIYKDSKTRVVFI